MKSPRHVRITLALCLATALPLTLGPIAAQGVARAVTTHRPVRSTVAGPKTGGSWTAMSRPTASRAQAAAQAIPTGSGSDWLTQNPVPSATPLFDVQFVNATTGWALGWSQLLRTTDGGVNWTVQNPDGFDSVAALDFVDPNHGWAVGYNGLVMRTQDGGATWTKGDSHTSDFLTSVSFVDTSTGWAVSGQGETIKTTDGGATWNPVSEFSATWPTVVEFVDTSHGWIVCEDGSVLRTTDGGTTWSDTPVALSSEDGFYSPTTSRTIHFINASEGWAVGFNGIFHTTDGGIHWNKQSTGVAKRGQLAGGSCLSSVSFTDASHGCVTVTSFGDSEDASIFRTEDGGQHWTAVDLGSNIAANACSFVDSDHGWVVGTGGPTGCLIEMTADGGKTWSSQTSGLGVDLAAVSAMGTQTAVAAGADGEIVQTENGGTTWAQRDSKTTQALWGLTSIGTTEGWAVGDEGTIRHTIDGGNTWESQSAGTSEWLGAVCFLDAKRGWASGGDGTLLKTADGGKSWQSVPTGQSQDLTEVQFVDDQTGWALASGGVAALEGVDVSTVLKTTDGGATWTDQNPWASDIMMWSEDRAQSMSFADAQHGWVVGQNGGIAYTADGGATWSDQYSRTGSPLTQVRAIDASTAVAVSDYGEILRTNDAGASWWQQVTPESRLTDISFASRDTGWAVGSSGLIIATTDGGGAAPAPSTLEGTVRSAATGRPVAGAVVELETYPPVATDAAGHYVIPNIMPGTYDGFDLPMDGSGGYLLDALIGGGSAGGVACSAKGYVATAVGDETFSAGSHLVTDITLTSKAKSTVKAVGAARGKLAVRGAVTPAHKAAVVLRCDRLVDKKWVHVLSATFETNSSGLFSYSHRMAKGTWRVRAAASAGRGYASAMSAWAVVKVR